MILTNYPLDNITRLTPNMGKDMSFGSDAPSRHLPFPRSGNITAVELLTFFPNCIRSADVVYRLMSNGGARGNICAIINTFRALEKEWSSNNCGRTLCIAMREGGFEGWTTMIHARWHTGEIKRAWDGHNVSVSGLRVPCQNGEKGEPGNGIPFCTLGRGLRKLPKGDDALDLTRMIDYCVKNEEEKWIYPRDYDELLHLLGGPNPVKVCVVNSLSPRLGYVDASVDRSC